MALRKGPTDSVSLNLPKNRAALTIGCFPYVCVLTAVSIARVGIAAILPRRHGDGLVGPPRASGNFTLTIIQLPSWTCMLKHHWSLLQSKDHFQSQGSGPIKEREMSGWPAVPRNDFPALGFPLFWEYFFVKVGQAFNKTTFPSCASVSGACYISLFLVHSIPAAVVAYAIERDSSTPTPLTETACYLRLHKDGRSVFQISARLTQNSKFVLQKTQMNQAVIGSNRQI